MVPANLRKLDHLDWLSTQEEWVLFDLSYHADFDEDGRNWLSRELQLIREIKAIVAAYEAPDEQVC